MSVKERERESSLKLLCWWWKRGSKLMRECEENDRQSLRWGTNNIQKLRRFAFFVCVCVCHKKISHRTFSCRKNTYLLKFNIRTQISVVVFAVVVSVCFAFFSSFNLWAWMRVYGKMKSEICMNAFFPRPFSQLVQRQQSAQPKMFQHKNSAHRRSLAVLTQKKSHRTIELNGNSSIATTTTTIYPYAAIAQNMPIDFVRTQYIHMQT